VQINVANLGRIVITHGEMDEPAIIPHHQVANAPVVPVHEARRDRVFAQEFNERLALHLESPTNCRTRSLM